MPFTNDQLFNCCLEHKEPDWSEYLCLAIVPVAKDENDRLQPLYRADDATASDTWTILAQQNDIDMEWELITDAPAAQIAAIARELENRSNLPVSFHLG